eukprot:3427700-Prymnesium_polylepis.1
MVLSVARARACAVGAHARGYILGTRYLGNGLEVFERTPQRHASYMPPCHCGVHSHNSKPFPRYRVPRE